jgi:hypothetical protein
MALTPTSLPRPLSAADLPSPMQPSPFNTNHSSLTSSSTAAADRAARTRPLDPARSNPHSARGVLPAPRRPDSRFPPLEVFVRRPPEYVAPPSWGRHPKTFTACGQVVAYALGSYVPLAALSNRSKIHPRGTLPCSYSITSLAIASSEGGIVMPSMRAVSAFRKPPHVSHVVALGILINGQIERLLSGANRRTFAHFETYGF